MSTAPRLNAQIRKESMMTTDVPQRTATIYQFPVGGRRAVATQRNESKPVVDVTPTVAASGAWYHDAAIQDSKRAGER
jgi:hypothetical protein